MSKLSFLLLAVVFIASTLNANPYESTLTEASRVMKKTKGVSAPMISSLRAIIVAKDATQFQKYFAAHLISSSDTCTSKQVQFLCPEVETLFQNRIEVGKLLGKKAAFGAARVRGDFYFDKGKFDPAVEAYEFLTWAPGGQHEYAILKLGWSYLNKKEAKKAFVLWTLDLGNTLKGSQPPSRNLVHGLGQSFSENLERSNDDVKAMNGLSFSAEDREALAEGLLDGLYFLTTADMKAKWTDSIRQLKIYPVLVRHMLVDRVNTLLPNCDYLALVNDKNVFSQLPPSKDLRPVLNQCVTQVKKTGDKALMETLVSIYENSDLSKVDPYVAFVFFAGVANDPAKACQVGVSWAFRESDRKQVALKETSSVCKAAIRNENTLTKIVAKTESLVKSADREMLENSETSAVVLLALMMDEPLFHAAMMTSVAKLPNDFKPTLVPTLLAEQLARLKQWNAVTQLKQTLKLAHEPTKKGTIWSSSTRALLIEKIQKSEFSQTQDLISELNLYGDLSQENLAVLLEWSRVFYNDHQAEVSAMVTRVSRALTLVPSTEQYQVLVELMLNLRHDKEVSRLIEKFGLGANFHMHPAFDAQLFDRVLEKSIEVNLIKVKSPQYKKLIFLAQALAKRSKLSPADFDVKGNSPLHEEFALVKKVYAKSDLAHQAKLLSLDKISRWVDFLQTVSVVSKRKWVSYHLLQQSLSQSKVTLEFIDANLAKLPADKDIAPEEWDKILATLHQKVSDAKDLLNDLSAKAKQTAERQAP